MKQHPFVIPSGQFTASISGSGALLTSSSASQFTAQSVSGFGAVQILAIGDQPFCVVVQESCSPAGPFITTHTFCSTTMGGLQVVSQSFAPAGTFVRFTVVNGPTPQSQFVFCANGVPVATTTQSVGSPGSKITSAADTAVAAGATVPLPTPPAGTRRETVQVTGGDSTTRIRVREAGGTAGAGKLLQLLGSTLYGGADGAVGPLEVQNVVGPAAAVSITFEG